ncbi:hypothetical protein T492DRAFT_995432 [Pavlovales sp. CCMP2436]|nr:hypothetical protein T492DRAFT_995432 [Pavlovales sp. CCMP2436]
MLAFVTYAQLASSARPAPDSSTACARALAASSAAMAARVTRALGAGGVVVHTSECGTFDMAKFERATCMRLELDLRFQGTSRGSFLHASLPTCLFFTTKGEGNNGSPTADIGWLFANPRALWQGPAWPQDSWAGTTVGTHGPHFMGSQRRRCAGDGPSSNETRINARNYAMKRFQHFKLHRGCGSKPASASRTLPPPPARVGGASATRDECERAGSFMSIWHFVKRANGCYHEHWAAAIEKQRAFVDLLDRSGVNSFPFKLYNEVFVRYTSPQISAVYFVNTTSSLESDVERRVSMSRARQALEMALLAAHVRSSAAVAAASSSGDKESSLKLRAARQILPVLEYRHGPGASNLRRSQLVGECWDGSAVNARIRAGLPVPPGLGFAPPAESNFVPALESLHRQGLAQPF